MKRRILLSSALVAIAVWALTQASAPPPSLARYAPPGPLLILEAQDFSALVRDWNGSPEKQAWLTSASLDVFSRSRLFLRLADAAKEFSSAAGLPTDMALVDAAAGGESVVALYDIGNLQFLYITKLPSARLLETALWRLRSSYETRNSAGQPYFIRTDPASHRVAAFAAAGDYLLLATREDLMAGALALIAGHPGATARDERWYAESVRAAGQPGDLRLVMDLAQLVRSPYFRSYWIQRNVSEIRQYGAGIADLHRGPADCREERVLLRFGAPAAEVSSAAMAQAMRLVPDGTGFYRAWANPSADTVLDSLRKKMIAPGPSEAPPSEVAPGTSGWSAAGSESELETRIDEPPMKVERPDTVPAALRALVESAAPEALVEIGSTRKVAGGVFVGIETAVVVLARSNWDANAVRNALAAAPDWGPLGRVAVEAQGGVLAVSNSGALAKLVIARAASPAQPSRATYSAKLNHAAERARFVEMMQLLDNARGGQGDGPQFFSGNLAGLSTVLARVGSQSVVRSDTGAAVFETVTYKLAK